MECLVDIIRDVRSRAGIVGHKQAIVRVWGLVLMPGVSVDILGPCIVLATILRHKDFALYLSKCVTAWSEAKDVMDAGCHL